MHQTTVLYRKIKNFFNSVKITVPQYINVLSIKGADFFKKIKKHKILTSIILLIIIIYIAIILRGNSTDSFFTFCAFILFIFTPIYIIILECKKILDTIAFFIGTYIALFTIAWAKYEFSINRENQTLSTLTAIMPNEHRKNFAPLLSETTQIKINTKPNIFSCGEILAIIVDDSKEVESRNAINIIASILTGYQNWSEAKLAGINMSIARLSDIAFHKTQLKNSTFKNARLRNIEFNGADLRSADFSGARIINCTFNDADLSNSSFKTAYIENSKFIKSNLKKARLENASLKDIEFKDADLSQATLKDIQVLDTQGKLNLNKIKELIKDSKSLYETKLPANMEEELKKEYPHLFKNPSEATVNNK